VALTGEETQQIGVDGAIRAKRWLEATCRAQVIWTNPGGIQHLQYRKASAASDSDAKADHFSFDLGGTLLGDRNGQVFLAECKKYSKSNDQGVEYRKFLAKAYQVERLRPKFCDHYIWITWAPFLVTQWDELNSEEYVRLSVLDSAATKSIALHTDDYVSEIGKKVAERLMVIVLGDVQESVLTLQGNELLYVRQTLLGLRESYDK
jgi:hypothetical protein